MVADDLPDSVPEASDPGLEPGANASRPRPKTPEAARPDEAVSRADVVQQPTPLDPARDEIELIFGITRAVGTPATAATEQLRNSLSNHGYDVRTVKVSKLLEDSLASRDQLVAGLRTDLRVAALIQEGNRLCAEAEDRAELARSVIAGVKDERSAAGSSPPAMGPATADEHEREEEGRNSFRRAFIIDSLKRPDEVILLREVYGDHFILVGLLAEDEVREEQLVARIAPLHEGGESGALDAARDLMSKDASEAHEYGQRFLDTFALADVFIDANTEDHACAEVRRAISILFGDPQAPGPTTVEFAMQVAAAVSALSPELGLRVGATIISPAGDVIATGTNHHPTKQESPAYDAGALDIRQLALNTLQLLDEANMLTDDVSKKLAERGDDYVQEQLRTTLKKSQLREITEYQRPVHAEMDALLSAAHQRADLEGATVVVTDFPCHNCAKHLIALGLTVVYLAPYLKSRAAAMYGSDVRQFSSYTGIAPSRYRQWFAPSSDAGRKDKSGVGLRWSEAEKRTAAPRVTNQITAEAKSLREDFAVGNQNAAVEVPSDTTDNRVAEEVDRERD